MLKSVFSFGIIYPLMAAIKNANYQEAKTVVGVSTLWRGNLWAIAIFIIAAYLSLVNLGNAPLWKDEFAIAWGARNILLEGVGLYDGWNGRNLHTLQNVKNQWLDALSSDLKIIGYPPWPVLPSALGVYLFGANEVGVRFFHALIGLGALLIFWLLLRLEFPRQPRLRLLAFAMFALLPQTILFFRYGRYAADVIFFALLLFYFYRLYMGEQGRRWHLIVVALAMILGFLSHCAVAAAFALTLVTWHLMYYARETSRRQWTELIIAALLSGAICLSYLLAAGIIGGGNSLGFVNETYVNSWLFRKAYFIYNNLKDIVPLGWLPLWVALWLFLFAASSFIKSAPDRDSDTAIICCVILIILFLSCLSFFMDIAYSSWLPILMTLLLILLAVSSLFIKPKSDAAAVTIIRWGTLIILFLFFSGLLTLRPIWRTYPYADTRYLVIALPFTALITAAFIDWIWQTIDRRGTINGAWFALPLLLLALTSNALSYPYLYSHKFAYIGSSRLALTGLHLVAEIHRPYDNHSRELIYFLNRHARQDDTIHIDYWGLRGVLLFYLSDRLIFCCSLNKAAGTLPEHKIRALSAPLYYGDVEPIWVIVVPNSSIMPDPEKYTLVYSTRYAAVTSHRPELEYHSHVPVPSSIYGGAARVYRRKY